MIDIVRTPTKARISALQKRVLLSFEGTEIGYCYTFENIETRQMAQGGEAIGRRRIRLACRALKREGLLSHDQYFTEDGFLGGSGYTLTLKGQDWLGVTSTCP